MRAVKRLFLKWTRTLHIYVSMFALLALFFFAATGFMLNHPEWFDLVEPHKSEQEGTVPPELVAEPLDKLTIAERIRADFRATGIADVFEIEETSLHIVYHAPGQTSEFRIDRESGHVKAEIESFGLLGRLTELHRGKYAGAAWGLLIDIVSVLLLFISLTGLFLWLSLRRRLAFGTMALLLGISLCLFAYFRLAL